MIYHTAPVTQPGLLQSSETTVPTLLVLGPLRLLGPEGDAALGGVRLRRLLAALALRAGEILSADRLIDAIWGQSPPRTVRQNLHTYLWSLRCSMSAARSGQLAVSTWPAGYQLDVAAGALDWDRFRTLSTAGQECVRSDPAAAGRLLRQALDLWRGSPVADVAEFLPDFSATIAAMEEARLTALEQRIGADLGAGLERELVAELAELTAAHPFREPLRAQQMLALYRCERRAEALSVFHQLRRELADDLGVDPSPKLGALFEAMLHADPILDANPAPALPQHSWRTRAAAARPGPQDLALRQRATPGKARA